MKYVHHLAILAALTVLFSFSAFAGDKTARSITIGDPVSIGTTQLKPGDYKIEWQGSGPAVQVNFMRNGKTVATMPATLQVNDPNVKQDQVLFDHTDPNTVTLKEIDFGHQKESLVFAQNGM